MSKVCAAAQFQARRQRPLRQEGVPERFLPYRLIVLYPMGSCPMPERNGGCPAFLLNIEKRSLPRLMLSGDGLASKDAV